MARTLSPPGKRIRLFAPGTPLSDAQTGTSLEILTPWYPPAILPVHKGWYETLPALGLPSTAITRKCWDGHHWRTELGGYAMQRPYWRGLAEPPATYSQG